MTTVLLCPPMMPLSCFRNAIQLLDALNSYSETDPKVTISGPLNSKMPLGKSWRLQVLV